MSNLTIYPCIKRSDWDEDRIEFCFSEGKRIDITFEDDGSGITVHGSGPLTIEPRVSNEITVRLRKP